MGKVNAESIIGGALALIAGFAWRDAFEAGIDAYFPIESGKNVKIKFIYAIAITIMVFVMFYIYMFTVIEIAKISPTVEAFVDPLTSRMKNMNIVR